MNITRAIYVINDPVILNPPNESLFFIICFNVGNDAINNRILPKVNKILIVFIFSSPVDTTIRQDASPIR